jgi:hypothetical protein
MYFVNYFTLAIGLAVLASIAIAHLRKRKTLVTESRIKRMMICCGIKEKTALHADHLLKLDMGAVRSRCQRCPVTELCDRWLDGEAVANNSFCPNAWHFKTAAGLNVT